MSKTNVRTDFDKALKHLITEININHQVDNLESDPTSLVLHELRKQFATKLEIAQKVELSQESNFAIFTARISIQNTIGNKTELYVLSENSMFAPKESLLESSLQAKIQKDVLDSTVSALGVISLHKNNRALDATSKDVTHETVTSEEKSSKKETDSTIIVNSEAVEPPSTESNQQINSISGEKLTSETMGEDSNDNASQETTNSVVTTEQNLKSQGKGSNSNKSPKSQSSSSSVKQVALDIINDMSDNAKEKPISDKGMEKIRELCKEAGITPEIAFLCMRPNRRPNKVSDLTDKMGYRITSAIKSSFTADDWKKKVQKEYASTFELLKRKGAQKIIDNIAIKSITSPETVEAYLEAASAKQLFELHIKITAAVNRLKNQD